MRALTWHGRRDVRVDTHPDPEIAEPTSTGLCLPLLTDDDPLGVDEFATHRVPLEDAPAAYEMFQQKEDGAVKVLFQPS